MTVRKHYNYNSKHLEVDGVLGMGVSLSWGSPRNRGEGGALYVIRAVSSDEFLNHLDFVYCRIVWLISLNASRLLGLPKNRLFRTSDLWAAFLIPANYKVSPTIWDFVRQ